jgi:hypothetical protein
VDCFSKIKKPNKNISEKLCIGNQSVIVGVLILRQLQLRSELCFIDFEDELAGGTKPIRRTIPKEYFSKVPLNTYSYMREENSE